MDELRFFNQVVVGVVNCTEDGRNSVARKL